ncbi:N-acetylmuramoyl-L-alanine amidase [Mycobacterium sp. TY815]|uniref:N-acetylmuramoyl-L-alanine amidase n=1 Tax=Mycobacterium sp. TY815 TaxID=3050581 RepID=UPI002740F32C|nr:N-acetylmuramoyl-L-alanine amidase [Mycobacterium sp. TY815]MDP7703323.1 N-acetylmuramoyl-L-alanine amidase [Mycobacterium sp. TY815]
MDSDADSVSRRRLLSLAGGLGLTATIGACAGRTAADPAPVQSTTSAVPATPSSTASAQRAAPASALCRDAWGARPAKPGGTPQTIGRMTLHHAAVVLGANSNAPARFRADQRYHQDTLGWIDIAYHFGVDANGNIYELRRPDIAGDTATDYNTIGHFLVICEGDFDKETVPDAQVQGAARVFAWAAARYGISTNTLAGHRDLAQTSCPGKNLYAYLASGELKHRVDTLLEAGGVDLQPLCGAAGAARVADIEAGN